jgi:hypothetical protein
VTDAFDFFLTLVGGIFAFGCVLALVVAGAFVVFLVQEHREKKHVPHGGDRALQWAVTSSSYGQRTSWWNQ